MKKTTRTSKLVLDRQTIRQLTKAELDQPNGGIYPVTDKCGNKTASCVAACGCSNGCP